MIVPVYLTQYYVVAAEKRISLHNADRSVNHPVLCEQRLVFIAQGPAATSLRDHRATAAADRDVTSGDDSWKWGWRHWLTCQLFYRGGWPRLSASERFSPHDGLFTTLAPALLATSSESLPYITWPITPRWPFSHLNQIISTLCLISVAKSSVVFTWVCGNNISPWESCWMGKQAAIKQSLENR